MHKEKDQTSLHVQVVLSFILIHNIPSRCTLLKDVVTHLYYCTRDKVDP